MGRGSTIPEITEVERLRRQLTPAWSGRRIVSLAAPLTSPNPRKYFDGPWPEFRSVVLDNRIEELQRIGKHLLVRLSAGPIWWHIHLSSTGWFRPGNLQAHHALANMDPLWKNFLHTINGKTRRLAIRLDDGQIWDYHDGRTWGTWRLWYEDDPYHLDYFAKMGPDWLDNPQGATTILVYHDGARTIKDVLCDQHLTAGLGNYLAVEAAFRAGLHPHQRWSTLTKRQKIRLCLEIRKFLEECTLATDHEHWAVFDRLNQPCPKCSVPIAYAKDGINAKRGSYFCPACQPKF